MINALSYSGHQPEIIVPTPPTMVILRCEIPENLPGDLQQNGKYVHLRLTTGDAMHLLQILKNVQKELGLPDAPGHATVIHIPPAKDRN